MIETIGIGILVVVVAVALIFDRQRRNRRQWIESLMKRKVIPFVKAEAELSKRIRYADEYGYPSPDSDEMPRTIDELTGE